MAPVLILGAATAYAAQLAASPAPRVSHEEKCLETQHWTEETYRACRTILEGLQPAEMVGGRTVPESEFISAAPWQAEIRSTYRYTKADIAADRALPPGDPHKYFLDRKAEWERQHRCGGVYIGDGWLLTAAHCLTVRDPATGAVSLLPNLLTARAVRLGTWDLS